MLSCGIISQAVNPVQIMCITLSYSEQDFTSCAFVAKVGIKYFEPGLAFVICLYTDFSQRLDMVPINWCHI